MRMQCGMFLAAMVVASASLGAKAETTTSIDAAAVEGVSCAFVNTWTGSWGTIPETPEEAENQKAFVANPAVLMEGSK